MASETIRSSAPSSIPGSIWQCKSIKGCVPPRDQAPTTELHYLPYGCCVKLNRVDMVCVAQTPQKLRPINHIGDFFSHLPRIWGFRG
jgi:hypothetical protein